jgi:hypothetical protein
MVRPARAQDWAALRDDELLELRISSLGLKLDETPLRPFVDQLYAELSQKGLVFHPPCEIGDEWFVPVGLPVIFIPFFLAHDRLRQLEKTIILDVEGETPEELMKLIRHEAAHAYSYAYPFVKTRRWQRVFGKSSAEETPSFYRPRPYSRSFVINLDDWYAQSHPDEDFAETFAVWLAPGLDWRARYKKWPAALQKLEYVDELMKSLAGKPPVAMPQYRVGEHDCLNVKLKTYYARKRKAYEHSFPDFYDNDLRRLFGAEGPAAGTVKASAYLQRTRRELEAAVCQWTNEKKYRVNRLVRKLIDRCQELNLYVHADGVEQGVRVSAYVTTLVMNHLFTGSFKRTK